MEDTHRITKRRRRDRDSDTSSESSYSKLEEPLWDVIKNDYNFIMSMELMEDCKNERPTDAVLRDVSIKSCIYALQDLSHYLRCIEKRLSFEQFPRILRYSNSPLRNELQHSEERKIYVCQWASSLLQNMHKPTTTQTDEDLGQNSPISNDLDRNLNCLSETLDKFEEKWDYLNVCTKPLDPLSDQAQFIKDIRLDLSDIEDWLRSLDSNLPLTSTWMLNLGKLTETEQNSANKYYEMCLKQIGEHARTLTLIRRLFESSKLSQSPIRSQINSISKTVCLLEATCHTLWLRLLELTVCTESSCDFFDGSQSGRKSIETTFSDALSSLTCDFLTANSSQSFSNENDFRSIPIDFLSPTGGLESGFESELSPPTNSYRNRLTSYHPPKLESNKGFDNPVYRSTSQPLLMKEIENSKIENFDNPIPSINEQCRVSSLSENLTKSTTFANLDGNLIKKSSCIKNSANNPDLMNNVDDEHDNDVNNISSSDLEEFPGCLDLDYPYTSQDHKKVHPIDSSNSSLEALSKISASHNAQITEFHGDKMAKNANTYEGQRILQSNQSGHLSDNQQLNELLFYDLKKSNNKRPHRHNLSGSKVSSPFYWKASHRHGVKSDPSLCVMKHLQKPLSDQPRFSRIKRLPSSKMSKSVGEKSRHRPNDLKLPFKHPDRELSTDSSSDQHESESCRSSSVDNDSDMERKRWRQRVRSYLRVANQAEQLVRKRCTSSHINLWLNSPQLNQRFSLCLDNENSPEHHNSIEQRDSKSAKYASECKAQGSQDNVEVEDPEEPLLNCWDDYQASLYSNSSDSQGCEPISTFNEDLWEDAELASLMSDQPGRDSKQQQQQEQQQTKSFDIFIQRPSNDSTPTGPDKPRDWSNLCEQDTLELSTSTSLLFHHRSSTNNASFELCSQSIGLDDTMSSGLDKRDNRRDFLFGLRTRPDGGSQYLVDKDPTDSSVCMVRTASLSQELGSSPTHYLRRRSDLFCRDFQISPYPERKYQTVPRVTGRKRKASKPNPIASHDEHVDRENLSLAANLDNLGASYAAGVQQDILKRSNRHLTSIQSNFQRLLIDRLVGTGQICRGHTQLMTLTHWNERIAHLSEVSNANVRLLSNVITTIRNCSNKMLNFYRDHHQTSKPDVESLAVNHQHSEESLLLDALDLKSQWMTFHEQVYGLLHQSDDYELKRQQLESLKAHMTDLNKFVRHLGLIINADARNSDQEINVSSTKDEITKQLHNCLLLVETLSTAIDQFQDDLNLVSPHDKSSSLASLTWNTKLQQDLNELINEFRMNQKIVNNFGKTFANPKFKQPILSDDVDDHDEHNSSPVCPDSSVSVVQPGLTKLLSFCPKFVHRLESHTSDNSQHGQLFLIFGGLVALICFCSYLLMKLFSCGSRHFGHRGSLAILTRVLGWDPSSDGCPLKPERVSSIADYVNGANPF